MHIGQSVTFTSPTGDVLLCLHLFQSQSAVSLGLFLAPVGPAMRSFPLPLLLLLAVSSLSSAGCPEGWQEYRDKCYKYVDIAMSWHDAGHLCDVIYPGATLASVHDVEMNAYLARTVADYNHVWIGMRRPDTNGSWYWSDGVDTQ